ncbi:MAG: type II secretion system protein [Phycisphaeraceae bacterium]|nr:type II secretion system protein [Phycisphaeraceae bacterium]
MIAPPAADRPCDYSVWPTLLTRAVGAYLALGGLWKAASPWELIRAIEFSLPSMLPGRAIDFAAASVAGWEAMVGLWLILAPHRVPAVAAAATLIGYSAVLARFALDSSSPRCGCLSLPFSGLDGQQTAQVGLARNAALLWLLWRGRTACPMPRRPPRRTSASVPARPTGFSIVELLVVIAILGIVVALALPALSRARTSARDARDLSTVRHLSSLIANYAADHADCFPYFQTPGDPFGPMVLPPGFSLGPGRSYFMGGSVYWPNILRDAYIPPAFAAHLATEGDVTGSNLTEGYPADTIRSRFLLTHTVFAAPRFWRDDLPPLHHAMLRPVRTSEVLFPSLKGLMLDLSPPPTSSRPLDRSWYPDVGRMDGSAGIVRWDLLDHRRIVRRPYGAWPWPILSSRDGVHGRDF